MAMTFVNFYRIRQRIIKHAIYLTRSNNPWTVKVGTLFVGTVYFFGLLLVWHLFPMYIELGLRTSVGLSAATFAVFRPDVLTDSQLYAYHKRSSLI